MRSILGISAVVVVVASLVLMRNAIVPSCIGVKDGKLAPIPGYLNAVSSQTEQARHKVEPMPFKSNLEETQKAILKALERFERIELRKVEGPYIHALSKSGLFGTSDDIEFYLDANEGVVHFRSAPRLYTFNKDASRDRYEQIVALY
ncbi:DUF1499 domain-containing protein [Desulfosediminicola sp.]|uniref:DUF1499 domain-containing protein n=1 Tax=Desulfosediminicola sp. TaxID=2886825 RepID=UPI003AF23DA7